MISIKCVLLKKCGTKDGNPYSAFVRRLPGSFFLSAFLCNHEKLPTVSAPSIPPSPPGAHLTPRKTQKKVDPFIGPLPPL